MLCDTKSRVIDFETTKRKGISMGKIVRGGFAGLGIAFAITTGLAASGPVANLLAPSLHSSGDDCFSTREAAHRAAEAALKKTFKSNPNLNLAACRNETCLVGTVIGDDGQVDAVFQDPYQLGKRYISALGVDLILGDVNISNKDRVIYTNAQALIQARNG